MMEEGKRHRHRPIKEAFNGDLNAWLSALQMGKEG
jgi:hypothetical protein